MIEMEKQQLEEERKKLEEEKEKFMEMTSNYREEEEKRGYAEEDPADSGLGSRSDTAEVRTQLEVKYHFFYLFKI